MTTTLIVTFSQSGGWLVRRENTPKTNRFNYSSPAGVPRDWPIEKVIQEVRECNPGCRVVAGQ